MLFCFTYRVCFQLPYSGVSGVGVTSDITFNTSSGVYIIKLQDGLYYERKISAMGAILRKYTSSLGMLLTLTLRTSSL